MSHVACAEWELEVVGRGPDWLFVKLHPGASLLGQNIADDLWAMLHNHMTYRLVLELDQVPLLPSYLLGQLVVLQKRVLEHDGALRLCGLNANCAAAIRACRLDSALPNHLSREDAVQGRATKPR